MKREYEMITAAPQTAHTHTHIHAVKCMEIENTNWRNEQKKNDKNANKTLDLTSVGFLLNILIAMARRMEMEIILCAIAIRDTNNTFW